MIEAVGCIVVAAGYGSLQRKNGAPYPKVLECVGGLPMLVWPLLRAEQAGITESVVVVNPRDEELIRSRIELAVRGGAIQCLPEIVVQPERRGSADAVLRAIPLLCGHGITKALVTYGDMPLWSTGTVERLLITARRNGVVTMVTVVRDAQYPALDRYGRVVRSRGGDITSIVEPGDAEATYEIRALERVNPSLWVWDLAWLRAQIPAVVPFRKHDGYHDELYMPPLVAMAAAHGHVVGELALSQRSSCEALGVNDVHELETVRALIAPLLT